MTTAVTVVADLPTSSHWEYGGFPYGLEPLILPAASEAGSPGALSEADRRGFERTCLLVDQVRNGAASMGGEAGDEESVTWFRWITGHQVSFAVWRLMAWLMQDLVAGRAGPGTGWPLLACYVRAYSAMLRYTSSCPRRVYHDLIRPSMYRQHPGFSGGWAPDYRLVRRVFRGQPPPGSTGAGSAELAAAVADYQALHADVAARLVPGGRSLLRDSVAARHPKPAQPLAGVLYDNYFVTLRAPVGGAQVVAQLLRRLLAVEQDLACRPPVGGAELAGAVSELARNAVLGVSDRRLDVPR
ncbi:hypothetical protein AMES_5460 [Amycolatopsis mediterranei S699]|uniref:L-tyrosine 3-hydroxylase n=2 Tax=Amycolatopsis mediterranei TaxID=33910 RepID=A0A0H3D8I4_AMYMU|nr:hypothetical protein [Amycolatopsis mediterranei]ADJ47285.1 hypothetical protein AMED_5527 [Amycolatopsis mediterranei U32]AEK44111.1 hypothetical protein RAM_28170 [Amycolatopsis mediterranei S699]AFO78996.1 hypothetical protein AMES_5460 [Amycolatopsis mediterranei S699]AGT86124.1 hypothetical protein B737_5460 [Amycolatopsis mediterranei RB]KDO12528.1 hypothetical protein DV26_02475 [Amycolatopsis mediterranei]